MCDDELTCKVICDDNEDNAKGRGENINVNNKGEEVDNKGNK